MITNVFLYVSITVGSLSIALTILNPCFLKLKSKPPHPENKDKTLF